MFTGIVEELGNLKKIYKRGSYTILEIQARKVLEDTSVGDSICVEGVCLTVKEKRSDALIFEVMPHTLRTTTLGFLKTNQKVNLERSLKLDSRLSGHFVLGHVDCIGLIRRKIYKSANLCFEIAVPKEFIRYCIPKGSVAVDGISLTIVDVRANIFSIYITPLTYQHTTLSFKTISSRVNVEFDILIKGGLKNK